MASYYDTLGVSKSASEKDIRQAYRRLARKYHPDLNPGDEDAEGKFKEINTAHEVLSDRKTRQKYDRYGDKWKFADQIESQHAHSAQGPFTWTTRSGTTRGASGSDPFAGVGDLFGDLGGRLGRQGRAATAAKLETTVDVTLEEAFAGTKRNITITTRGRDRRIEVTIPPGVDNGSVVRIRPGAQQELLLTIELQPHPTFTRSGSDLFTEVDVPLEDAVLGGEVEVRTLTGGAKLKVPAESQNGQRVRLRGQGMPKLGSKSNRGDLYAIIRPRLPKQLSEEQKELFEQLKAVSAKEGK